MLLVLSLFAAGCTESGTTNPGVQTVTTAVSGPLYADGDVVKNPSSSSAAGWLILGYDAASDTYERALIYPNADGTWGYRADSRTENADRALMEKVYSSIVANRAPAAVPIGIPTTATTVATTVAPVQTTVTAATTTSSLPPKITKIIPDKGDAGTTVQVTDLVGENFRNGANVTLSRAGSNEITATNVRAVTPKSITCTFAIPADSPAGSYDVVVTNPDGQSDRYTNIFDLHRTPGVLTTTYATSAGSLPITFIDPSVGHIGYAPYTITGSGFKAGAGVKLQKEGAPDIDGKWVTVESDTRITCFLDIPMGSFGSWDVRVTNTDKSYGVKFGMLTVN